MADAASVKHALEDVASGRPLTPERMAAALAALTEAVADDAQRAAFLMGLRVRGETIDEIAAAARFLRSRMLAVTAPAEAIDIVGTGGDGHGTYNISTAAAIVTAAAGVPVAKHGNRSVSSKSGSSDVLAALGVKIDLPPAATARVLADVGLAFLWAPMHHPAMKVWAPARASLKLRTLFNVLGPLCNPAVVRRQVLGVYDAGLVEPIAMALRDLGTERAFVVHGSDGMDELTTTGPTRVAEIVDGTIVVFDAEPADAGLPRARLADLQGGDASANAAAVRRLLDGEQGAYRDIVVYNAGAALVVAGRAGSLADGVEQAQRAVDNGSAGAKLEALIAATNRETNA
ncbi:MAG: anthranilate phosphoribosyltransferase [Hyphomicrobiaceae bacterium]|nr:anthranilate phosphoribosyltransferase [Hyphomicrobiaceae bacterium]